MRKTTKSLLAAVGWLLTNTSPAEADVRLPDCFGDHMVLQQGVPIPVWGWADPGEEVNVTLADQTRSAAADAAGRWSVRLGPLTAGGPHRLRVKGRNLLERTDVMVGEVWLCSGQSNMAMTVSSCLNFPEEARAADLPALRMFTVARKTAEEPQSDASGEWKVSNPQTVGAFSATAYFFGRRLHRDLGVPVGLLHASWGGTPIQAWTRWKVQEENPELKPLLENFRRSVESWDPEKAKERFLKQLEGWKAREAQAKAEGRPFNERRPSAPQDPRLSPNSPARLYNGMVAPLVPFGIRGFVWYQGESNAGNAQLYGHQLKLLIRSWREDWGNPNLHFISVQLPNFMAPQKNPVEDGWALIREQFLRSLALPNVGMVVTIDIGEAGDIHPKNKQDVGHRLAQWALAKVYGRAIVPGGPIYRKMERVENKIVISFDQVGQGLTARGGEPLRGFAIAGPDRNFVWADAQIRGDTVIVSGKNIIEPVAVRYAWANNPSCNLFNIDGFPASPFRTDGPERTPFDQ